MRRALIFVLIAINFFFYSCKKEDNTKTYLNNWDEDIDYFSINLTDNHKNLFHNISQSEFVTDIADLRSKTNELTDAQINIELFRIISKIGDSHTSIGSGSYLSSVPLMIEWLSDGFFITHIHSDYQQYLGNKIVSINGVDLSVIINKFRTIIAYENEYCFKLFLPSYLRVPEIYQYFGYSNKANTITFNLENGNQFDLDSGSDEMTSIYENTTLPLYLSNTSEYYWYELLDNDNLLYIQYNKAWEMNNLPFQTFTDQISGLVNQNSNISKIAIDLRLNTGGNSTIAKPLFELLQSLILDGQLESENIYIIIGRKTFSSAVLNSIELQKMVNPIFIGEPSGGKPNHYGEVKSFFLPNSHLKVRYSSNYFSWVEGDPPSIIPNISMPISSEDLLQGHDPNN